MNPDCCHWPRKHLLNNRNTKKKCEMCSKLRKKIPERRQWFHSVVFIIIFKYISHLSFVGFECAFVCWGRQNLLPHGLRYIYFHETDEGWCNGATNRMMVQNVHFVEMVRIRSYSGPYFPAFVLNTERYCVLYKSCIVLYCIVLY